MTTGMLVGHQSIPLRPTETSFPPDVLHSTAMWLHQFAVAWHSEIPERIHSSDIDSGGAPELHPDFIQWVERPCDGRAWCSKPSCKISGKHHCHDLSCSHGMDRINDPRHRTHRAFRKLRRAAPREFDATYLLCARGLSLQEVAQAMTERALRLGKPERYSEGSILVLAVAATDKLSKWY